MGGVRSGRGLPGARRRRRHGRRLGTPLVVVLVALAWLGGLGTGWAVLPRASAAVGADAVGAVAEFAAAGSSGAEVPALTIPIPVPAPVPVSGTVPAPAPAPVDPNALDAAGLTAADRAAGLLSTDVPPSASGDLVVVPGSTPAPGAGPVRTVRVEVERGLPVDAGVFAAAAMGILNDPRGWGAGGAMSFARTDGDAELRVVLASPATVDALCAPLTTDGLYSCGTDGHAVINFLRWSAGAPAFGDDRALYRDYVINHEVGHLLGHHHERCPGPGLPAPLMQQQSAAVGPCLPSGFPFP